MFRMHKESLSWTDTETWRWPQDDKKLVSVFNQVNDIDLIMEYVKEPGVCVQAGGACGIWPLRFSQLFEQVYTFEPQRDNYKCLVFNINGSDNIQHFNAALSDKPRKYSITNTIEEKENWGAGYVVPDDKGNTAMLIDDLELERCDLIQLDVEGHELQALYGAAETIRKFKPVIVLEEKWLSHIPTANPAAPRQWLENEMGYKMVDAIHRDVILC